MASDPRDYKLDLSAAGGAARADAATADAAASSSGPPSPRPGAAPGNRPTGRPFLSVHFACCGAYQRVYRAPGGACYEGRCPRCGRPVKFVVGDGGTSARAFVAR